MDENTKTEEKVLTPGEKRLKVELIPGNNDPLQNIAEMYVHLYNKIDSLRGDGMIDGDKARTIATCQTDLETSYLRAIVAASN